MGLRRVVAEAAEEAKWAEAVPSSWSDPESVEANADGRVTPAQWTLIAGRRVRLPCLAYAIVAVRVVGTGLTVVAVGRGAMETSGSLFARVAGFFVFMVVYSLLTLGSVPLVRALGLSRRRPRDLRRRRIAALRTCRIASGIGEVAEGDDGERRALLGASPAPAPARVRIPVPAGAPALPSPGPYRLYWLEPAKPTKAARPRPGSLLLSAQPLDRQEADIQADIHAAAEAVADSPPLS